MQKNKQKEIKWNHFIEGAHKIMKIEIKESSRKLKENYIQFQNK